MESFTATYLDKNIGGIFTYRPPEFRPFSVTGKLEKGTSLGEYQINTDLGQGGQVIRFLLSELNSRDLWKGQSTR